MKHLLPLFIILFSLPVLASAQGVVPCDGPDCQACHVVQLGQNLINWFIGIMATFIALVFVIGGLQMVMSGGNSEGISKGKAMMTNAVIGFFILLGAWLIVDTLLKAVVDNQKLGTWNEIKCVAQPVFTSGGGGTATSTATTTPGTTCSIPPLAQITDPAALQMEAGQTVVWNNENLRICATKFASAAGGSITSAYRPQSYQDHLFAIRDRWCTQGLQNNVDAGCTQLKNQVQGEVMKHFGGGWSCGAVGQTSAHTSGNAVDVSGANGSVNPSTFCLVKANYTNDPWHYNYTGCTCN